MAQNHFWTSPGPQKPNFMASLRMEAACIRRCAWAQFPSYIYIYICIYIYTVRSVNGVPPFFTKQCSQRYYTKVRRGTIQRFAEVIQGAQISRAKVRRGTIHPWTLVSGPYTMKEPMCICTFGPTRAQLGPCMQAATPTKERMPQYSSGQHSQHQSTYSQHNNVFCRKH